MFRMSKAYDRRIASDTEDFALALARAALYTSSNRRRICTQSDYCYLRLQAVGAPALNSCLSKTSRGTSQPPMQ